MRFASCAFVLSSCLCFAEQAHAELDEFDDFGSQRSPAVANEARSDSHLAHDEERPGRRWYGWQTLAFDATSIGAVAGGIEGGGYAPIIGGLVGYVFGGPIVHGAHAQSEKAIASFMMRVSFPFLGLAIGKANVSCENRRSEDPDYRCGTDGAFYGALLGVALAITLDAAVLANEDTAVAPKPDTRTSLRVLPEVSIAKDRAVVSLGGVF